MFESPVLSVVVALVFPIAWGLGTAWLFDWLRARKASSQSDASESVS